MKYTLLLLIMTVVKAKDLLETALEQTWIGIKQRNIDAYEIPCVHRPNSETPNDCVSEGIGYGMILALYSNDQEYFDKIWESGNTYMWNGNFYDWRINEQGQKTATGAATDAEQDIAFALISAQSKVDKNIWKPHNNPSYQERYQNILDSMWKNEMISQGKNINPGAGWGYDQFVNPGYFAPAWYKIFKQHDKNSDQHDWDTVINNCYNIILNNVGFENGLIPDWTNINGDYYDGSLGYNAYFSGHSLFKDAIRIFWRISTDYLWFKDERAFEFISRSYTFITKKGGAKACNFYQMNGDLLPENDIWEFAGYQKTRHRREHSHLTIGMWSTIPYALNTLDITNYTNELLSFYENTTYWGLSIDPYGNEEDIEHNEMYFDQFLAWFGAIILNGTWIF